MKPTLAKALEEMTACVQELQRCMSVLHAAQEPCAVVPDIEPYLAPLEEEIRQLRQLQRECSQTQADPTKAHLREASPHGGVDIPDVKVTWHDLGEPEEAGPFESPGVGRIMYVSQRHIDAAAEFGPGCIVTLAPSPISTALDAEWVIWKIDGPPDEAPDEAQDHSAGNES